MSLHLFLAAGHNIFVVDEAAPSSSEVSSQEPPVLSRSEPLHAS